MLAIAHRPLPLPVSRAFFIQRGLAYGQFQSGIQRAHILLAAHTIDVCSKVTSH
jgi:hypothetical protein